VQVSYIRDRRRPFHFASEKLSDLGKEFHARTGKCTYAVQSSSVIRMAGGKTAPLRRLLAFILVTVYSP
jgi:hypothetical protein